MPLCIFKVVTCYLFTNAILCINVISPPPSQQSCTSVQRFLRTPMASTEGPLTCHSFQITPTPLLFLPPFLLYSTALLPSSSASVRLWFLTAPLPRLLVIVPCCFRTSLPSYPSTLPPSLPSLEVAHYNLQLPLPVVPTVSGVAPVRSL